MEYRMYVLVLRQLDGINKGIQATHACLEYALKYGDTEEYQNYINNDKTVIILNGGTSIDLYSIYEDLVNNNIKFGYFREPDLDNMITAICFLADERVYNGPTLKEYLETNDDKKTMCSVTFASCAQYVDAIGGKKNAIIKDIISNKRLAN